MEIIYSTNFKKSVEKLPKNIKEILKRKIILMCSDINHPSLRIKKIQGHKYIFEASISMSIRMTWQYTEKGILLRNIGEHDKTLKNP